MTEQDLPVPLTDLRRRDGIARQLIRDLLTELVGPVDLELVFQREWNGRWKVHVETTGSATGSLEFRLLETPNGGILALPSPMPERWRVETGIRATDDSLWSLDRAGVLTPFPPES